MLQVWAEIYDNCPVKHHTQLHSLQVDSNCRLWKLESTGWMPDGGITCRDGQCGAICISLPAIMNVLADQDPIVLDRLLTKRRFRQPERTTAAPVGSESPVQAPSLARCLLLTGFFFLEI